MKRGVSVYQYAHSPYQEDLRVSGLLDYNEALCKYQCLKGYVSNYVPADTQPFSKFANSWLYDAIEGERVNKLQNMICLFRQ